jgi:class 3 adenylate cyclase/tetratricopeptide (TPR) repeat protein
MLCSACGTENAQGKKFCTACGAPLSPTCTACGAALVGDEKFCGECGAEVVSPQAALPPAPRDAPAAERRLVSILFADLVGFTTLSESRDAEEVRELLSRYFDSCQRLISLFGGTVEKFIGDAVMAVWGTPVAQEDDAERAVRAALDLVSAVSALGDELGAPQLAARAGVLTGEAAVTLGAEGQGMVAGDLVNTASRVQAVAEPGTVLVGEATKRASEAAVAYEDAGEHELKGKAEPVRLWRARRVTASRGGAGKAQGLEPPFVGRDRELRLVKELFHASAEEGKAHLVSVVGIAGIGKSRLAWEFEKYLDGVLEQVWWHRGRCLAYGEGVAYWALAEMVRMRARITDDEAPETALVKLRTVLEEHVPDAGERGWLEPRLAHLLGLGERTAADRDELFSAWRLFFERLADSGPTVLVFEDLQWADMSLLDFVEHLLDWSRSHPLFVLALARPELAERRPGWGAAGRNATTLSLEPLAPQAMEALLDGFVPGLPTGLRAQILERAEGVPLYAVETIRMLLDRGLLEREGDVYRPTGRIDALDVPETLHALIAARLDGLSPEERRLVQDAAVLGKSFTKAGLAALSGSGEEELDPVVTALVRKEIFSVQADPRSPERGQYSFLQDLLKRIAYETLARKDRKERHLAAAVHLEQAWGSAEQEVVEVVAAHYLDAYSATPEAEDAAEIKAKAFERLVLAAERAASLAATEEAQHYYSQAAEIAADPTTEAELLEQAGVMALQGGRLEEAIASLERSIELFEAADATHPAARVAARLGRAFWLNGDLADGADRLEKAFQVLADDEPDADLAAVAAELGRLRFFLGDIDSAAERVDRALEIAESLGLPEVLAEALNTKHLVLDAAGRYEEALGLLERAYAIALEHELGPALRRALINLSYQLAARDNLADAKRTDLEGLELARKRGDRDTEGMFLIHLLGDNLMLGEWDEVLRVAAELDERGISGASRQTPRLAALPTLRAARGELDEARRELTAGEAAADDGEVQQRVLYALCEATVLRAEGRSGEALAAADRGLAQRGKLNARHPFFKHILVGAVEAALDLDDLDRVTELLGEWERMRPTDRTPFLEGHYARFVSRLAVRRGQEEGVEPGFDRAQAIFRELGMPFYLGIALVERGEWLVAHDRAADAGPLLAEAREIFERLEARPWLERVTQAAASSTQAEVVS